MPPLLTFLFLHSNMKYALSQVKLNVTDANLLTKLILVTDVKVSECKNLF